MEIGGSRGLTVSEAEVHQEVAEPDGRQDADCGAADAQGEILPEEVQTDCETAFNHCQYPLSPYTLNANSGHVPSKTIRMRPMYPRSTNVVCQSYDRMFPMGTP